MNLLLLEVIPLVAFYVLIVGNVITVVQWMVHVLRQTGGFPSSREELQSMATRVDQEETSQRAKRYKKRMAILWISCFGIIILSSIVRTWII